MYRFIAKDGTEHSAADVHEFAARVRTGAVTEDTLVFSDENQRWMPASGLGVFQLTQEQPISTGEGVPHGEVTPSSQVAMVGQGAFERVQSWEEGEAELERRTAVQDLHSSASEAASPVTLRVSEDRETERGPLPWASAIWVRRLLYVMVVIGVWGVLAAFGQLQLVREVAAGGQISAVDASASDRTVTVVSILWLAGLLNTGIMFIVWQRRLYDVAHQRKPQGLRYKKGWTIWGWVIPVGFLFIPYQILKDARDAVSDNDDEPSEVLPWWWLLWLGMLALGWLSSRAAGAEDLTSLHASSWIELFYYVTGGGSAALAAAMVAKFTRAAAKSETAHEQLASHDAGIV